MLSMPIITPGMSVRDTRAGHSGDFGVTCREWKKKKNRRRSGETARFPCSQERRRLNEEIESFRRMHQRAEDRRDYDLYDPEALKKSRPARVDDNGDDPSLGVASAQKCVNSLINTANNEWCNRERIPGEVCLGLSRRR